MEMVEGCVLPDGKGYALSSPISESNDVTETMAHTASSAAVETDGDANTNETTCSANTNETNGDATVNATNPDATNADGNTNETTCNANTNETNSDATVIATNADATTKHEPATELLTEEDKRIIKTVEDIIDTKSKSKAKSKTVNEKPLVIKKIAKDPKSKQVTLLPNQTLQIKLPEDRSCKVEFI